MIIPIFRLFTFHRLTDHWSLVTAFQQPRQQYRHSSFSGSPTASITSSIVRYLSDVTFRSFRIHSTISR